MSGPLEFDWRDIEKLRRVFGKKIVQRALVTSLVKLTNKVRAEINRQVTEEYNVSRAAINRRLKVSIDKKSSNPEAMLRYIGTRIGLINFKARVRKIKVVSKITGKLLKRKEVSVQIKKKGPRRIVSSRKFESKGFVGVGASANKHIFARILDAAGRSRKMFGKDVLAARKTLSIPEMVDSKAVLTDLNELVKAQFPLEFNRSLTFHLQKAMGLLK